MFCVGDGWGGGFARKVPVKFLFFEPNILDHHANNQVANILVQHLTSPVQANMTNMSKTKMVLQQSCVKIIFLFFFKPHLQNLMHRRARSLDHSKTLQKHRQKILTLEMVHLLDHI